MVVKAGEETFETGLKKFGAMLGDNVEVGCNSVLNPGTVIGKNTNIYPTSMVRGLIPPCYDNFRYETKAIGGDTYEYFILFDTERKCGTY